MSREKGEMDPVSQIVKELRDLKEAGERLDRRDARKADWDVPGESELYVRDLKRGRRRALLDLLCPKRQCCVCETIKSRSRQWVVFSVERVNALEDTELASSIRACAKEGVVAVCRSCVMLNLKGIMWDRPNI